VHRLKHTCNDENKANMKYFAKFIFIFLACFTCYSQKEISKNGQKINKLDKKNKKQASWFFFDQTGNLEASCYYQNDSIVTPIVFYNKQDSIFVRHPKVDKREVFFLKSSKKWVVGTIMTHKADSTEIEVIGRYIKTGKDTFDIQEEASLSNSASLKKEAEYWSNREIKPIYLFGTEELREFYFRQFNSSKMNFNKAIVIDVSLNEAGNIENIDFPRNLNTLNYEEESELAFLFSRMERWQPYFSKNTTIKTTTRLELGSSVKN
jgi:hypothetical protein